MARKPKPTKSLARATEAPFRPLAFPTRESWDAYVAERAELRRLGVGEDEARLIADERTE